MTKDPACCTPETKLPEVARLMIEHDCGAIPVVGSQRERKPVGIITDRDITCRAVAAGKNPLDLTAGELMTTPVTTVTPAESLEECVRAMDERRVRRVPVVDEQGICCGIVAQADVARWAPEQETAELVRDISERAQAGAV
jgi:CBS domain-containing protein